MKAAFFYIIIIGLLFAGLLFVLKTGEKLHAPPDVAGEWNVDEEFVQSIQAGCIPLTLPEKNLKVLIQQSGIHLTLVINSPSLIKLTGRIENHLLNFHTTLSPEKKIAGCNDYINLELTLELHKQSGGTDELKGIMYTKDCKDCPELKFSAVRSTKKLR